MNNLINLESLISLSTNLTANKSLESILHLTVLTLQGKLGFIRAAGFINRNSIISAINPNFEELANITIPNNYVLTAIDDNFIEKELLISKGFNYCLSMKDSDKKYGYILLGGKFSGLDLSEDENRYANLVSQICTAALKNEFSRQALTDQKNQVLQTNHLLSTLFDISKDFSLWLTKDQILNMLSNYLMGQLLINRFALIMYTNSEFEEVINRFDGDINICEHDFDVIKENIVYVKELKCQEFKNRLTKIGAILISPIILSGKLRGLLFVGKRLNSQPFTSDLLKFIEALAFSAGSALENERLLKEEIKQKQLERDFITALEIQKNLLPKSDINLHNYSICGMSLPSRYVGGDYFDYIHIGGTKYLIIIADVSGKGLPASLIMANLQAALHVLADLNMDLEILVKTINNLLFTNTSADKFVTAFFAVLDVENHTLEYISAGHNPPLYFSGNGAIKELSEGGMLLGFLDNPYHTTKSKIILSPNDLIMMYTDGITEAQNINNIEFGEENLMNIIAENLHQTPSDLNSVILEEINKFTIPAIQYDDMTLITIKRLK